MSKFTEFYKSQKVEKPGNSTHTEKWDRCVLHVKESGSGADPYAVCTAMLGQESFKSMDDRSFGDKIKYFLQKLGIAGAGPVPNSLLAAQDLEGETRKSRVEKMTIEDDIYDMVMDSKSDSAVLNVLMERYNLSQSEARTQLNRIKREVGKSQVQTEKTRSDIANWLLSNAKNYKNKQGLFDAVSNKFKISRSEAIDQVMDYIEDAVPPEDRDYWKSQDLDNFAVWYYDPRGNQKCAVFGNAIDAKAYAEIVSNLGYKDVQIQKGQVEKSAKVGDKVKYQGDTWEISEVFERGGKYRYTIFNHETDQEKNVSEGEIHKGQVEQTGKQLQAAAAKAEEVDGTSEEKSLAENIKAIQLRRQKATLVARAKEMGKTFREAWKNLK